MTELARILHVEDEPDIRQLTKMALENIGRFQVLSCDGAEQALAQAEAFAPQLMLLDLMMPGKDGIQTYQELRELPGLEETPVVFMTARVRPEDIAQLTSVGAADVVSKPFDPMTLSDRLRELWAGLASGETGGGA